MPIHTNGEGRLHERKLHTKSRGVLSNVHTKKITLTGGGVNAISVSFQRSPGQRHFMNAFEIDNCND